MTEITTLPAGQKNMDTLLFVDDEQNILSSLNRLFRPLGYRIFVANGAAAGLAILEKEAVDLVVSDMRMPEMDGAKFLEHVATRWPDTVRILLTGYAEISSAVNAINKGGIYKYISKPWEDEDLKLCVQNALERKHLLQEKLRLEQLTAKQNEELRELNVNLEMKVASRTEEVRQTMAQLELTHESLKSSYSASVKVFSSLIEMREQIGRGHARRVAELASKLAVKLGMSNSDVQDVMFAGLLHDIGKIGWPDKLLNKSFQELTQVERRDVVKHPVIGQGILMSLEPLQETARYIRSHHEQFDGQGFPDALSGDKIPLGARILAVANDYDALQLGTLSSTRLSPKEAHDFIMRNRAKRYDPKVVDVFAGLVGTTVPEAPKEKGVKISSKDLRPGMIITTDLITKEGVLLLSRGYVLDDRLINKIQGLENSLECQFVLYVVMPKP